MKKKNILHQLFNTAFPWLAMVPVALYFYLFQPQSVWQGLLFFVMVAALGFWGWVRSQK